MNTTLIATISDQQLLNDLKTAAASERQATAHLTALLAEMDVRRLYLAEGYSSLFTYCTQALRLSEHAAYGRIEAARAARKFPIVLELLMQGAITLTTLCLLANHLTRENHRVILEAARYKSKREVEQQVATIAPKPDAPSRVRKLPAIVTCGQQAAGQAAIPSVRSETDTFVNAPPPVITGRSQSNISPLAPERYKVQITISRETIDKLRRVQDLMRHVVPNGDPAVIFDRALTLLLGDLEKRKLAQVDRPRVSGSHLGKGRQIPAAVKREVWARDRGQCAFVGTAVVWKEDFWNSTTWSRSRTAARQGWRTCSFVAGHITPTKRGNTLARCSFVSARTNSVRTESPLAQHSCQRATCGPPTGGDDF